MDVQRIILTERERASKELRMTPDERIDHELREREKDHDKYHIVNDRKNFMREYDRVDPHPIGKITSGIAHKISQDAAAEVLSGIERKKVKL